MIIQISRKTNIMHISNVEKYIDDMILQRGYAYFRQGKILTLI